MRYASTRGGAPSIDFLDAVLAGLAPDGGLYVPDAYPVLDREGLAVEPYAHAAASVLAALSKDALAKDALAKDALDARGLAEEAYRRAAWPASVTPLTQVGPGQFVLELFHGPSLAFKDVAMQLIGPLYERVLAQRNERLTVVCATSGDTGGAAVEALKNRERVDLFVLLPKGRVSDVQRRFMIASGASNVHAIEFDDDFDACQAILKSLFADRDFTARAHLSAVNSVNWARIVAQSVYFHVAANILAASGPVNFSIPTGNFGDAFSAYVAKRMGAPIGKLLIATNANDIVARAILTGRYARAPKSHATLSPAMDIQVASNFERLMYEALDGDAEHVRRLYEQFAQSGGFDVPKPAQDFLRANFDAVSLDDPGTQAEMRAWREAGYLACPHSAIAMSGLRRLKGEMSVALATAHPAKFPETVQATLGVRPQLPAHCADLFTREEKLASLPADVEAVKAFIRERTRAWT